MSNRMRRNACTLFPALLLSLLLSLSAAPPPASAETCTTQSQMAPAERDSLAAAARVLALKVQANDIASLRLLVEPEYDKDPGPMTHLVASVSPKLKDAELVVEQVYLLDATGLKPGIDGKPSDAEFFCSLNKSPAQTDFLIPGLPAGRYGFVIVSGEGTKTPWSLSFLLRQENRSWLMAGFYPKPLTAAGHDGVWYWTQARELASQKRGWNAYLFYHQAQMLLQPVNFISSTNLDKLKKETEAATPPALSEGISANAPLVVKAADGTEYRFTSFTTDDSLGGGQLDVAVHLQADTTGDSDPSAAPAKGKPAPARLSPEARNRNAMSALLAAYPELRSRFHGVWVFADTPGQNPVVTEAAMAEIH